MFNKDCTLDRSELESICKDEKVTTISNDRTAGKFTDSYFRRCFLRRLSSLRSHHLLSYEPHISYAREDRRQSCCFVSEQLPKQNNTNNNCNSEVSLNDVSASVSLNYFPVIVNVYTFYAHQMLRFISNFLSLGMLDIHHTTVFVHGEEWSFFPHPFDYSGVVRLHHLYTGITYKTSLFMGCTKLGADEIKDLLSDMGVNLFKGSQYRVFSHNCNTFVSYVTYLLTGKLLPSWVTRAENFMLGLPKVYFSEDDIDLSSGKLIVLKLYMRFAGNFKEIVKFLNIQDEKMIVYYKKYIRRRIKKGDIPRFPRNIVSPFATCSSLTELFEESDMVCTWVETVIRKSQSIDSSAHYSSATCHDAL